MGQGALILGDPSGAIGNPFFLLVPELGAAPDGVPRRGRDGHRLAGRDHRRVLASPSRRRGSATSRGCGSRTPRSGRIGQIYVPWINWALLVAVLTLVFAFKTSTALAYAYGVAVTGTITITTLLFFYLVRCHWRSRSGSSSPAPPRFFGVDLLFLAANLTKIPHGAWLPLVIAIAIFTVLTTWQRGRELVTPPRATATRGRCARSSSSSTTWSRRCQRVPGHRRLPQPRQGDHAARDARERRAQPHPPRERPHPLDRDAAAAARARLASGSRSTTSATRDDGISHVTARFGYMDTPDVPGLLPLIREADDREPARRGESLLLPLDDRAPPGRRTGPEPLAEEPLPRNLPASPPTPPSTSTCRSSAR